MVHPLGQLVPLQDTLLQVDDVWVLALDAAEGPELPQGQLHILWRVAADLLHRHPGACALHYCLIDHAVTASPHLLDQLVLWLAAYHPSPHCGQRTLLVFYGFYFCLVYMTPMCVVLRADQKSIIL